MKRYATPFFSSLMLLWISHFLVDFMIGIWSVYKTIAGIDLGIAGLIAGLGAFTGEGMQLFFGMLSDRGYTRALIGLGALSASVSAFMPYSENIFLLFFIYLLTCIGSGAFHPSASSSVGSLSDDRKGFAMAVFASGGAFGLAVSQILFSHTYHYLEGHTCFLTIPTLLLCFVLYNSTSITRPAAQKSGKKLDWKWIKSFFQNRDLTLLYLTQVLNQSMMWGMIFLLPDVLVSRSYDTWIAFGAGHFFFIIGGAIAMIPGGYLADKYSSRQVMMFSPLIGLAAFLIFILNPALPASLLFIILFVVGASIGVVSPVLVAYGHKLLPDSPGLVSALLMGMAWCLSELIGPGGGGMISRFFEEDAAAKALVCLSFLLLASVFTSFLLPKREKEFAMRPSY